MKSKHKNKEGKISAQDLSYCIEFSNVDMKKNCPVFMKAVDYNEVHLFTLLELQTETETLIASLAERSMYLVAEIGQTPLPPRLQPYAQSKELTVKSNPDRPLTLIISQKRAAGAKDSDEDDSRPWKRLKIDTAGAWPGKNKNNTVKSDCYVNGPCALSPNSFHDSKQMYKIPNKFWALMEPYCAEMTEEHVQTLESLLAVYEGDDELYKIPPLGGPVGGSSSMSSKSLRGSVVKMEPEDVGSVKNKSTHSKPKNLKRRIDLSFRQPLPASSSVAQLADSITTQMYGENVVDTLNDRTFSVDNNERYTQEPPSAARPSKILAKQLAVSNSYKLEKHLRQNLKELDEEEAMGWRSQGSGGFLPEDWGIDGDDDDDLDECVDDGEAAEEGGSDGDEVVVRLRRRQRELGRLAEMNRATLHRLVVATRADIQRQEVRRRLAIADADVIEAYTKLDNYRQNRKVPLKRDRDAAWKTLKERKKVLKEQESIEGRLIT